MSAESKLRIFGVAYLMGDAVTMRTLLNRSYENVNELEKDLEEIDVNISKEPGHIIIDSDTGLVIESWGLNNRNNEGVGALDLVRADENEYYQLCKSAGHFDIVED